MAIVIVNWATVRNDADLKSMIKGIEIESQMTRLGTESSSVSDWLVFAGIGSRSALLIQGKFDRRKLAEHLKSTGWNEVSVEGNKLYSTDNDYASLADGVVIGGPREGVIAALQTRKNSGKNIASSASFKNIKDEMPAGKSPIMGFLIAPEGTLEAADAALSVTAGAMSLFGMGEIGSVLRLVNVASGVGFAVANGKSKEKCAVNFCVVMRDEKTASIASAALNAMKSLSSYVGTAGDKENLSSFNITQRKKVLSIKMEMPRDMLMPAQ